MLVYPNSGAPQYRQSINRERGQSMKWYGILLGAILGILVGTVIGYFLVPGMLK